MIFALYKENSNLPGIKIIKEHPTSATSGLIFPKRSPLAKLFYEFGLKFNDLGLYGKLRFKWFGSFISSPEKASTEISFGHTNVCFMTFSCVFVLCLLILSGELLQRYYVGNFDFSSRYGKKYSPTAHCKRTRVFYTTSE